LLELAAVVDEGPFSDRFVVVVVKMGQSCSAGWSGRGFPVESSLTLGDAIILTDTEFEVIGMFSKLGVSFSPQVPRSWKVVVDREKYNLMGCTRRAFIARSNQADLALLHAQVNVTSRAK
jgi:hypothetical protein